MECTCTLCNKTFQSLSKLKRHYSTNKHKGFERYQEISERKDDDEQDCKARPRSPIHPGYDCSVFSLPPKLSPITENQDENDLVTSCRVNEPVDRLIDNCNRHALSILIFLAAIGITREHHIAFTAAHHRRR